MPTIRNGVIHFFSFYIFTFVFRKGADVLSEVMSPRRIQCTSTVACEFLTPRLPNLVGNGRL